MNVWFCFFMGKFLSNRWESKLEGVENRATPQQTPFLKFPIFQQGPFTLSWHPSQQGPQKSSKEPIAPLDQHHCRWMLSRQKPVVLIFGPWHFMGWELRYSVWGSSVHSVEEDWVLFNIGSVSKQQQHVCRAVLTLAVFQASLHSFFTIPSKSVGM